MIKALVAEAITSTTTCITTSYAYTCRNYRSGNILTEWKWFSLFFYPGSGIKFSLSTPFSKVGQLLDRYGKESNHSSSSWLTERIMLTIPERHKVLQILKICSVVVPLTIRVDLAKWELHVSSTKKRWISLVSYSLFVLHSLYKHGSLVHAFMFVRDVQLHQIMIHSMVAIASGIFIAFWYFVAYTQDPALFAAFVKITLQGNIAGIKLLANSNCPWRS